MAQCPKCSAPISLEIEQYGGTCPNCFAELEGSIGEDCTEFEPTGMFTSDQFKSSESQNQIDRDKDEFTEELMTDEVDLDEVLVFEDEITEVLEVTEPIVKETSPSNSEDTNKELTKETTLEAVEVVEIVHTAEDDFDFEDEPTIALNAPIETSPPEESSTGGSIVEPDIAIATSSPISSVDEVNFDENGEEDVELEALPTAEDQVESLVFDEDSIEDFLVEDPDVDGTLETMGGIGISPMSEMVDSIGTDQRPMPKRQKSPIDWKPILVTGLVIGAAALAIFPKEEAAPVQNEVVEETFVPEIQTGTLDKPESVMKSSAKPKQKPKAQKPKAKVVEVGGVSTFQTAKPVRTSRAPTSTPSSTNKSAQLDRDVTKLKKSLRYCHTKALKNDPTVAGKWEVQFKVTGGTASNVRIKAMRSPNSEIESCMKTKIQRFGFTDGHTQNFKFRILFER